MRCHIERLTDARIRGVAERIALGRRKSLLSSQSRIRAMLIEWGAVGAKPCRA